MFEDIEINKDYSKEEIEIIFNTNFGPRIKGITLRRSEDGTPYILLFSRADGPYSDKIEGSTFYYDGEGLNKDQDLTTANKTLKESNESGRIIYGFFQNKSNKKWNYLGILRVLNYEYRMKNGYKTYEFQLEQTQVSNIQDDEIIDISDEKHKPKLKDDIKYTTSNVKKLQRCDSFRRLIKQNYNNTCAVCGKKRFTNADNPEVESCHIFPKEKQGSDDLRNGISLCKLHHWAFDSGLFSIKDDYTIIIKNRIETDPNYEEIYKFKEKKINLPLKSKPNPLFLKAHRTIHGFE